MKFFNLTNNNKKNNYKIESNGLRFLLINILSVIIFAFLYYINDYIITNYLDFAKKYKLVPIDYKHQNSVNSLHYYFWFSLVTQSTLGYSGLINEETGELIPFSKIGYTSHNIINIIQMFSIFVNTSLFM